MNIFDFINIYKREREREPFSAIESALYFDLLIEANEHRWQMPFPLHTNVICFHISAYKSNICKARDKLKKRRLIDYTKGETRISPAWYTLLVAEIVKATDVTTISTTSATTIVDTDLTTIDTPLETTTATTILATNVTTPIIIENKEKEINKEINEDGELSLSARESELLDLDFLFSSLKKDYEWRKIVTELMACNMLGYLSEEKFDKKLQEFFLSQKALKISRKTDADCRSHFINWLRLSLTNDLKHNEETRQRLSDKRGKADVPTKKQTNYDKPL